MICLAVSNVAIQNLIQDFPAFIGIVAAQGIRIPVNQRTQRRTEAVNQYRERKSENPSTKWTSPAR